MLSGLQEELAALAAEKAKKAQADANIATMAKMQEQQEMLANMMRVFEQKNAELQAALAQAKQDQAEVDGKQNEKIAKHDAFVEAQTEANNNLAEGQDQIKEALAKKAEADKELEAGLAKFVEKSTQCFTKEVQNQIAINNIATKFSAFQKNQTAIDAKQDQAINDTVGLISRLSNDTKVGLMNVNESVKNLAEAAKLVPLVQPANDTTLVQLANETNGE